MLIYPRTHTLGCQHQETGLVPAEAVEAAERSCGPPVRVSLAAGSASVHSDLVMHASPPSRSRTQRRLAISMTFTAMDGVSAGGSGWANGCFIPSGSEITSPEFVALPRPRVYAPAGSGLVDPQLGPRL